MDYSISELEGLTEPELLGVLKKSWGFDDKIEVWGELSKAELPDGKHFFKLLNPRSVRDNSLLRYPLAVNYQLASGIYMPPFFGKKLHDDGFDLIRCEVVLSPQTERDKHSNPLRVQVNPASVIKLTEIPIELE